MAMQEVDAFVGVEADQYLDRLEVLEQDGVLPARLPWEELAAAAGSRDDLERRAVDMDRVRRVAVRREAPFLDVAERHLEVDPVHVVELAVNLAHPIEAEISDRERVRQGGGRGQRRRDRILRSDLARHVELKQGDSQVERRVSWRDARPAYQSRVTI